MIIESDHILTEVLRNELANAQVYKNEEQKESELREQMDLSNIEHSNEPHTPEDTFDDKNPDHASEDEYEEQPTL